MKRYYGCVYKITNVLNHKVYVGKTKKNLERRFYEHVSRAVKFEKDSKHFYSAIRKYGKTNFRIEEIKKAFSENNLNQLEIYYIAKYRKRLGKVHIDGCNCFCCCSKRGGQKGQKNSMFGKHQTESTKNKIRIRQQGKKESKEARERVGLNSLGRKWIYNEKLKQEKFVRIKPDVCLSVGWVYGRLLKHGKKF